MANPDIMIALGSIDPHKGKMGGREACKLVEDYAVKGFKFHPTVQGFEPTDQMAWPIYEVINEHKLPAVFHSGLSGIGSGMRCGGGLRLQNSNPMLLEDVAIAFPDMQIAIAHPSWPWQDEALSMALHDLKAKAARLLGLPSPALLRRRHDVAGRVQGPNTTRVLRPLVFTPARFQEGQRCFPRVG